MNRNKPIRRIENGRLVYYLAPADEDFWESCWRDRLTVDHFTGPLRGELDYLEHLYIRWLPRDEPVLEAGCGRGQIVMALRQRGWQVEGVDYSSATIDALRRVFPDLPVRAGDVTRLDVPDGYYGGYISIGVIEHRREGPEPFLQEAHRVLRPGGIAIITVPHLNPLRQWKARYGFYRGPAPDPPFYQYAYSAEELGRYLTSAGFEILEQQPYGGYKGIIDEIPPARLVLGPLKKLPLIGAPLRRWLAHHRLGHMLAVVCRRRS